MLDESTTNEKFDFIQHHIFIKHLKIMLDENVGFVCSALKGEKRKSYAIWNSKIMLFLLQKNISTMAGRRRYETDAHVVEESTR